MKFGGDREEERKRGMSLVNLGDTVIGESQS